MSHLSNRLVVIIGFFTFAACGQGASTADVMLEGSMSHEGELRQRAPEITRVGQTLSAGFSNEDSNRAEAAELALLPLSNSFCSIQSAIVEFTYHQNPMTETVVDLVLTDVTSGNQTVIWSTLTDINVRQRIARVSFLEEARQASGDVMLHVRQSNASNGKVLSESAQYGVSVLRAACEEEESKDLRH